MTALAGKHMSFWIDSTPETDFAPLGGDLSVDVAVLGAGITGVTAAASLKRAGKTVALVEAENVVGGVTGHTTAKVTASHGRIYAQLTQSFGEQGARLYAESNQTAIERIAALVEHEQIDCDFSRQPNYLYSISADDVASLREEASAAAAAGLPASFVTDVPLPFPVTGAVRFDNQVQFHPRKYLLHLTGSISGEGSYVFEHTRALAVQDGDPCRVTTDKGVVTAKDVIVATQLPILDRGLFFAKVHPYRSYVVCPTIDPSKAPPGMFVSTESPTHTVRTSPYGERALMIIAGEGHKTGQEERTEERYERLEEWIRTHFGVDSIEYHWSTQDYYSVDHVPYIGKLRRASRHVYVATGYNAWGLTTGTLAAQILVDAILGVPNSWAELYDSNRVKPTSAKKFAEENINVAKRWIGDRLAPAKVKSVAELKPGQGAVLRVNGKQVAAYRDDQGRLKALSPVCTHLRCIVAWNPAERTWDCPCHGSRFNHDGQVVQGPAIHPLAPEEIPET